MEGLDITSDIPVYFQTLKYGRVKHTHTFMLGFKSLNGIVTGIVVYPLWIIFGYNHTEYTQPLHNTHVHVWAEW